MSPQKSVYIGEELAKEMREFSSLNWSQIAAASFENAIKLEKAKMLSIEEAKLERLRQSRDGQPDKHRAWGYAAGAKWAQDEAEYEDLERFANEDLNDCLDDNVWEAFSSILLDDTEAMRNERVDAIEAVAGDLRTATPDWMRGFAEGATEVFSKV